MSKIFIGLAILVSTQSLAGSGFWLGQDLLNRLQEDQKILNGGSYPNYAKAHSGIIYAMGVYDALNGFEFCVPSNVHPTVGQISAITHKYLINNPALWDQNAATIIADALKQHYPCKK